MPYTDQNILNAVKDVLETDNRPVELWRIAQAAELTEAQVAAGLIRAATDHVVTFRYPPFPCGAVLKIQKL